MAEKYGNHLIVDCAQALLAKPLHGIKLFYSPRKFVGVADGGIAYLGSSYSRKVKIVSEEKTTDHDNHLFIRKEFGAEAGFEAFQTNERKLSNQPIRWMSKETKRALTHIDFDRIIAKRRANFTFLHRALKEINALQLPDLDSFVCPMAYPFAMRSERNLRKGLIDTKVFVAKYWPNVSQLIGYEKEYELADRVVAIPCDQRYGDKEMKRIVSIILSV